MSAALVTHDDVEMVATEYIIACQRARAAHLGRALGVAQEARDEAHAALKAACNANDDPSVRVVDAVLAMPSHRNSAVAGQDG